VFQGGTWETTKMNAMDRLSPQTFSAERPEVRQFALRVVSEVARASDSLHGPVLQKLLGLITRYAETGDVRGLETLRKEMAERQISGAQIVDECIPEVIGRIGTDWHESRINALDATMAACRLQSLLREFAQATSADRSLVYGVGCVLFIMPVGEQHCLGSMIATDQLRRRGISVRLLFRPTTQDVESVLARTRFDGVFLSVSNSGLCAEIAALTKTCRDHAGAELPIVLGGGLVSRMQCDIERERLREATGVDFVAQNLDTALVLCKIHPDGFTKAV
jgi:hypothetical protein